MKKVFFLLALALPLSASAFEFEWFTGWDVEARVAAYKPLDKRFRQIYGNWGTAYEAEIDKSFCGCPWSGWLNFSWFSKKGRSLGLENKTRIQLFPLSGGVKYTYNFNDCWSMYGGVGVAYSWLRIHDKSRHVKQHTNKETVGAVAKYGLIYHINCNFFADFFADYIYQRFSGTHHHGVSSHSADCSAIKIGGGLGFSF